MLASEEAHDYILNHTSEHLALVPCPCRTRTEKLGTRECADTYQIGSCIMLGAAAYWKNGNVIVDTNAARGMNHSEERDNFLDLLKQKHNLKIENMVRKDGCMWSMPARKNMFHLGTGRVLLAGDAGGFTKFLGEGISGGLATGKIAAAASAAGINNQESAGKLYCKMVKGEKKLSRADFSFKTNFRKYKSGFPFNTKEQKIKSIGELIRLART
ncbi:MAG: hypothetical protein GY754_25460 [bacterium]|nr:hypothetical protein [bacterium]